MSSSPLLDPWLGRSIGERQRYRLDQRLGLGGMAEVFLAMDTLLGQPVALKLLNERLAAGEMRGRFEREVALCAALRSEHIVRVSDHGVTPEGYPFFVMEYLQGQTLRQLLNQEKRLSVERAINITTQVCEGLSLAHQGIRLEQSSPISSAVPSGVPHERVKVVHRDLKPDNLFLVPMALGELVKILDFGIAKIRSSQAEGSNATTVFLGTYRYAAPEQFEVGRDLDERADIYSLGMILYEMLGGTDPFGFGPLVKQASGGTWAVAHLEKPVMPLQQQSGCEHLPPDLNAIVMRCLQKDPQQRFASVCELSAALQTAIGLSYRPQRNLSSPSITLASDITCPALSTQRYWQPETLVDPAAPAVHPTTYLAAYSATHSATQPAAPGLNPNVAEFEVSQAQASQAQVSQAQVSFWPDRGLPRPALLWIGVILGGMVGGLTFGLRFYSPSSVPSSLRADEPTVPEAVGAFPSSLPENMPAVQPSAAQVHPANQVQSFTGHSDTVWAVALSPDGQTLVSGGFDKTIRLWNRETGAVAQMLTGHTDAVRTVAVSRDGQTVASGSSDKTIKIWQLQTGELLHTLAGHSGPVWSVDISSNGQILASGSYDGTIKLWDVQTGELLRTLPDHYDSVWSVSLSPDGQTLASGSYDGTIKLWDVQTGALLRTLLGHTEAVRSVDISPNGQILASGSWDKTVKIWHLQTGALLHTLAGHADRVVSVALAPSGQTVASGSLDRTIQLWDVEAGKPLQTLSGHSAWVVSVAFGFDETTLISGSKDRMVKVWQLAP
jgi:eukaryotic-like serine/threonine-protein kinase